MFPLRPVQTLAPIGFCALLQIGSLCDSVTDDLMVGRPQSYQFQQFLGRFRSDNPV